MHDNILPYIIMSIIVFGLHNTNFIINLMEMKRRKTTIGLLLVKTSPHVVVLIIFRVHRFEKVMSKK